MPRKSKVATVRRHKRHYKPRTKPDVSILSVTEQIANARLLIANAKVNIGVATDIIDEAMRSVGLKYNPD